VRRGARSRCWQVVFLCCEAASVASPLNANQETGRPSAIGPPSCAVQSHSVSLHPSASFLLRQRQPATAVCLAFDSEPYCWH
jgi:hypothetical protein